MKILLVNKFHYMKGGAERYYFTLADALKKSGHEVIFFSMKEPVPEYMGTGCIDSDKEIIPADM